MPLSPAQERRLVLFLDAQFDGLPTKYTPVSLADYIAALSRLLPLILQIPPSSSCRVHYLLRLGGAFKTELEDRQLPPEPADELALLWTFLGTLDAGWATLLRGESWPVSQGGSSDGVGATERVRLRSLLQDTRESVGEFIGVDLARRRIDIGGDVVEPTLAKPAGTAEASMSCVDDVHASLPAEDGLDAEHELVDDLDDSEFDEVDIPPPHPSSSADHNAESFTLSLGAAPQPQQPTLASIELPMRDRDGFADPYARIIDPDASDEDEELEREAEQAADDAYFLQIEEEVAKLFEKTWRILNEA